MNELMKFAMDKAFFEKKNIVALIETLPKHMREVAFLIAVGNWKTPEYCKVGVKGHMNGVTYVVTDFNPFTGVEVRNTKNYKDWCICHHEDWKQNVDKYKLLMEKRGEEYMNKLQKLQEEYKDLN